MIRPRLFIFLLFGILLALQALQQLTPVPEDPFLPGRERQLAWLVTQHYPKVTAMKLRHVRQTGPYDLLIFGNSSVLSQGQATLGEFGRVFNMAIPGSSLSMSAALADILASEGAAAPTLLVMVENFDHFAQHAPLVPLPYRWGDNLRQLAALAADPALPVRDWLRLAVRLAREERNIFTQMFNGENLGAQLRMVLADVLPPFQPGVVAYWVAYNPDGGAGGMVAREPGLVPVPALAEQPQVIPAVLAHDLRRLARLPGRPRVVVYESPLEPATARHYAEMARPGPAGLRRVFLETCAREGLECHLAPVMGEPGRPNHWMDYFHPPGPVLTPWLRGLLAGKSEVGRAVQ